MRRLMFLATLALAGCGARATVVQSGSPIVFDPRAPTVIDAPPPSSIPSDTIRPLSRLDRGWNRIPGRDGTGCAQDSTFVFRVRPGLTDRVFLYLNGGGACWRGQDCDPSTRPTYTTNADSANDASVRQGLFDVSREENPVREFTMIFVSACTGDAHLGARTVEYSVPNPKTPDSVRMFAIRHEGAANLESVLAWLFANVRAPQVVFVAGSNTGAIATPVVAAKIAYHYPRARVVQLGDGAGAYSAPVVPHLLASWGAMDYLWRDLAYRNLDSADFSFERLYRASSRSAPRVRFAQINSVGDASQAAFLSQLGMRAEPVSRLLAKDLELVRESAAWFRTYTAPGRGSTLLRSNALYTTTVDGVALGEWISALVNGEQLEDIGSSLLVPLTPAKSAKPKR